MSTSFTVARKPLYYPAQLIKTAPSVFEGMTRMGIPRDLAETLIANAGVNGSDAVSVPHAEDPDYLAIFAPYEGKVGVFLGFVGTMFDTPKEAVDSWHECVGDEDKIVAVFEYTPANGGAA